MVLLVTLFIGLLVGIIAGHRTSVLAAGFVFSFVVLFFIGVLDWFAYFFALTIGAFITSMLTR